MKSPDLELKTKTAAVILAGGKSSRMGQDKSLLEIGGRTLLERVISSVSPLAGEIVIMLSQTQKIPVIVSDNRPAIKYGRDHLPERGPLQGIADAIPYINKEMEYVFVLSCDLPHLTWEWLYQMQQDLVKSRFAQIVCSKDGNHLNPLIAIYRATILLDATSLVKSGKSSCLALLDDRKVIHVSPPQTQSHIISNINTPLDYREALEKSDT
ncbi:molybdenum cofactor guanylyltransferase [bacterium]|nr:molybdenum cofactor guanylyltransferase [bacterium]